jgi:two-component system, NtrC family, C4-dicarboxylate transport response regulator DctD
VTFRSLSKVVLAEDDDAFRNALVERLALAGLDISAHSGAEAALKTLRPDFEGVVVTDLRMPGMDGRQLARRLFELDPHLPVVMITGHGDVSEAVEAMKLGVYDFITKPFAPERLVETLMRALEKRALVLDNRRLVALADTGEVAIPLDGDSRAAVNLRAAISQLADAQVDVLIEGETGVGKEAVARSIHSSGRRRLREFVPVAFDALSEADAPGQLFGHEAGAFPGAVRRREGQIARAHLGTLFVDEIDQAPRSVQRMLLRTLEEREIFPLGASEPVGLDLRVLAATKSDPAAAVARGALSEDLYYRLNVVRLRVPPIRERREDIPLLYSRFLARAAQRMGRPAPEIDHEVRRRLMEHDWPGNLRELSNYASEVVVGIGASAAAGATAITLPEKMALYELEIIREALTTHSGDMRAVTEALGLPRKTLYDKLARHGLTPAEFRRKP